MSEIATRTDNLPAEATDTPTEPNGLQQWADQARIAHSLATSLTQAASCPQAYRGKPVEATYAILAGAELGLSPIKSLGAFDNIQGTVAPKAVTLRAIAQGYGHDIWLVSASPTEVVMRGQRKGSPHVQESVWTIERANQLGVTGKDNWKKQPQAMLTARATSEIARLVASDVLLGVPYSAEERYDTDPARPVVRSTATSRPRTVMEAVAQREAAPTVDTTTGEIHEEPVDATLEDGWGFNEADEVSA